MYEVECVVIGAGVIGLAVARALALQGREVVIVEREHTFGTQTSSHNSEVIHAGIYYPPGSLKAGSCVAGRELLYAYLGARCIAHRRCGKLIVATTVADVARLEALHEAGRRNGVADLERLDAAQVRRLEPALSCVAALCSPGTGIVDSHGYMLSLLADAEACGAAIAYGETVTQVRRVAGKFELCTTSGAGPVLRAGVLVNSAGLDAHRVAATIEGLAPAHIPTVHFAKGNYFALSGATPFRRLIYPIPEPGGLGIHLTLDLAGRARFGPDVQWVDQVDHAVDAARAQRFHAAIRQYWPGLEAGRLRPAYAGVRAKLSGPSEPGADFCISGPAAHGVAGLVNLFGMESPGLTASLALAREVAELLRG